MSARISVVIPTHERPRLLARCLHALAHQDLPAADFEIVVVHDGPGDDTRRSVAEWRTRLGQRGPELVYAELPERSGPAAARNLGARRASAPLLAFTDDDTVPDRGWLAAGLEALHSGADAAAGRIVMPLPRQPTDYERDAARLATAEFVTANCFCRAPVLASLGGFDERFALAWREDSDLHFRLLEAGAVVVRAPAAVVVHPVRPARFGVSVAQQRKIAFDALLYKKHRALYRARIRRAPRWDYYTIVAALLAALAALAAGAPRAALAFAAAWAVLTALLCAARLRDTARTRRHVLETLLTSALIPPVAVFWRIRGSLKYRVAFL